jgi:hypothetical protein
MNRECTRADKLGREIPTESLPSHEETKAKSWWQVLENDKRNL